MHIHDLKEISATNKINISVIVPVYNVEGYILECLESVSKQTMTSNVECILIDDCGNDNSVAIAENYINNYEGGVKFSLLHHEKNKGLSAARNTGTKNANGKYLYYLDSDDTLYPNCLEVLWDLVCKYPHVDAVQGSTMYNGDIWSALDNKNKIEFSDSVEWLRKNLCDFHIPDPAWNRLVCRDFIVDNHIFFAEGFLQEDTIWSYDLQKHIRSMAFCYEPTYFYRLNPDGIMNTNAGKKEAVSFAKVFNYVYSDMKRPSHHIFPCEIEYLELNALRVGKTGGQNALKLLCTRNNPFFSLLLHLDRKVYNGGRKQAIKRRITRKLKLLTRKLLCNRSFFKMREETVVY